MKPAELKVKFKVKGRNRDYREAHALLGDKLVGIFLFRLQNRLVAANGTRVLPRHQKKGIGSALWEAMIHKYNPRHIVVSTISEGGENLVLRMKVLHPNISWDWW